MTGLQHFNKEQKRNPQSMFNHDSLIPWESFRGRQEEKWGSSRGRDHFVVNLGIILGLGIISGSGSFRGLYSTGRFKLSVIHYTNSMCCWFSFPSPWSEGFTQEDLPFKPRINRSLALFKVLFNVADLS